LKQGKEETEDFKVVNSVTNTKPQIESGDKSEAVWRMVKETAC
jgi:hypothetical protein